MGRERRREVEVEGIIGGEAFPLSKLKKTRNKKYFREEVEGGRRTRDGEERARKSTTEHRRIVEPAVVKGSRMN